MTRLVLEDIQTHEENLRRSPELTCNVWGHGFYFESMAKTLFKVVSSLLPDSDTVRLQRIVLAKGFQSRLNSLISSIEQGAMDDELDRSPAEVIWIHVLNINQ